MARGRGPSGQAAVPIGTPAHDASPQIASPQIASPPAVVFPPDVLERVEQEHANGITSAEILTVFEQFGLKFSEATFRKYVQLGLLPRSVRVGQKGKHKGSQGMYPVTVVRQILAIKEMMAQNLTIEEIQAEFLFVRGDIEELERRLSKIFKTLRDTMKKQRSEPTVRTLSSDIGAAESLAKDLVERLNQLEDRLTSHARSKTGLARVDPGRLGHRERTRATAS